MIQKYYGRSIAALLLIPVAAMMAAGIFDAIDPELAAGLIRRRLNHRARF